MGGGEGADTEGTAEVAGGWGGGGRGVVYPRFGQDYINCASIAFVRPVSILVLADTEKTRAEGELEHLRFGAAINPCCPHKTSEAG